MSPSIHLVNMWDSTYVALLLEEVQRGDGRTGWAALQVQGTLSVLNEEGLTLKALHLDKHRKIQSP